MMYHTQLLSYPSSTPSGDNVMGSKLLNDLKRIVRRGP